jgi:hypothetical protein
MTKIDIIREKFKDKINPIDFITIANEVDNSKTKKYMEHLLRFSHRLVDDFEITIINEMDYIMEFLTKFDELAKNGLIENPDLNQYKNLASIKQIIKDATLTKSIGKAKKEIKNLYEDDKYMLFLPLSYDAASVYGRGTKWCVTQSEYFYKYTDKGILAYFIEKGINRKIGLYYDMYSSYYLSTKKNDDKSVIDKSPKEYFSDDLDESSESKAPIDKEMEEIYRLSNMFSCWTAWDVKMEMMFTPIPQNIKEIFINYCKDNNIQNSSLLNDIEFKNIIDYYEGYYDNECGNAQPMVGTLIPDYAPLNIIE